MEFQKELDNEKLVDNRRRLNKFANENMKRYEREIIMADNKKLDQIHADFENDNKLSFEESLLVQMVFSYIKNKQ